jgi:hypothetical protein
MPVVFEYDYTDLDIIRLDSTSTADYVIYLFDGPFQYVGKNYANTRFTVRNVQSQSSSNISNIESTYQFSVSDAENNTLGVLQYSFNFVQEGSGIITTVPILTSNVSFASGIILCRQNDSVIQNFDNSIKKRTITISKRV